MDGESSNENELDKNHEGTVNNTASTMLLKQSQTIRETHTNYEMVAMAQGRSDMAKPIASSTSSLNEVAPVQTSSRNSTAVGVRQSGGAYSFQGEVSCNTFIGNQVNYHGTCPEKSAEEMFKTWADELGLSSKTLSLLHQNEISSFGALKKLSNEDVDSLKPSLNPKQYKLLLTGIVLLQFEQCKSNEEIEFGEWAFENGLTKDTLYLLMTNKINTKEKFDDLAIDRIQTFALAPNQKKCVLALRRTAAGQISDEADGRISQPSVESQLSTITELVQAIKESYVQNQTNTQSQNDDMKTNFIAQMNNMNKALFQNTCLLSNAMQMGFQEIAGYLKENLKVLSRDTEMMSVVNGFAAALQKQESSNNNLKQGITALSDEIAKCTQESKKTDAKLAQAINELSSDLKQQKISTDTFASNLKTVIKELNYILQSNQQLSDYTFTETLKTLQELTLAVRECKEKPGNTEELLTELKAILQKIHQSPENGELVKKLEDLTNALQRNQQITMELSSNLVDSRKEANEVNEQLMQTLKDITSELRNDKQTTDNKIDQLKLIVNELVTGIVAVQNAPRPRIENVGRDETSRNTDLKQVIEEITALVANQNNFNTSKNNELKDTLEVMKQFILAQQCEQQTQRNSNSEVIAAVRDLTNAIQNNFVMMATGSNTVFSSANTASRNAANVENSITYKLLSDEMMHSLAEKTNVRTYTKLGLALDLSANELDTLEDEHRKVVDRLYAMYRLWREKNVKTVHDEKKSADSLLVALRATANREAVGYLDSKIRSDDGWANDSRPVETYVWHPHCTK